MYENRNAFSPLQCISWHGTDFLDGLNALFKQKQYNNNIAIFKEGIGFGGEEKDVYKKAEKLLISDDVDILIAFIDEKVVSILYPLIQATGKLLIVVNPGVNYPLNWISQPTIIRLSLQHAFLCSLTGGLAAAIYHCRAPANSTSVQWTIPAGATLQSGQGTNSITVSFPATAIQGSVTAQAVNNCSSSSIRSVTIKLPACPPEIPGLISRTSNNTSLPLESMTVNVFPNPAVSNFNLQVKTENKEVINVSISDMQGRNLKKLIIQPFETNNFGTDLKPGAYMIEVKQGNTIKTIRVLKF